MTDGAEDAVRNCVDNCKMNGVHVFGDGVCSEVRVVTCAGSGFDQLQLIAN